MQDWKTNLLNKIVEKYVNNSNEWVELEFDLNKVLELIIVSNNFYGKSSQERAISVSKYLKTIGADEISKYSTYYTVEESYSINLRKPSRLKYFNPSTWLELAYCAANPQNYTKVERVKRSPSPKVIVFYSYRDSGDKTTSVAITGLKLIEKGYNVALMDLNLESPGLSVLINQKEVPKKGFVDYFYDKSFGKVDAEVSIDQTFFEVKTKFEWAGGNLFGFYPGELSPDYMCKLEYINPQVVLDDNETLWSVLKKEVYEHLDLDFILIDSASGLSKWAALLLTQAADEALIFTDTSDNSINGTNLILEAIDVLGLKKKIVLSLLEFVNKDKAIENAWKKINFSGKREDEFFVVPHFSLNNYTNINQIYSNIARFIYSN